MSPSGAALHHSNPEAQADPSNAKCSWLTERAGQSRQEDAAAGSRGQITQPGSHAAPASVTPSGSEAPDLLCQFCLELLAAGGSSCARTQHAQQDKAQDAFNGQVTLVGQESLWVELASRSEHIPEVAHASNHTFRESLQVCISQLGLYRAGQNEICADQTCKVVVQDQASPGGLRSSFPPRQEGLVRRHCSMLLLPGL